MRKIIAGSHNTFGNVLKIKIAMVNNDVVSTFQRMYQLKKAFWVRKGISNRKRRLFRSQDGGKNFGLEIRFRYKTKALKQRLY